jgi:hypothetical protein
MGVRWKDHGPQATLRELERFVCSSVIHGAFASCALATMTSCQQRAKRNATFVQQMPLSRDLCVGIRHSHQCAERGLIVTRYFTRAAAVVAHIARD